eukprot:4525804-Heterocapsa_arctica.AAC.1
MAPGSCRSRTRRKAPRLLRTTQPSAIPGRAGGQAQPLRQCREPLSHQLSPAPAARPAETPARPSTSR